MPPAVHRSTAGIQLVRTVTLRHANLLSVAAAKSYIGLVRCVYLLPNCSVIRTEYRTD